MSFNDRLLGSTRHNRALAWLKFQSIIDYKRWLFQFTKKRHKQDIVDSFVIPVTAGPTARVEYVRDELRSAESYNGSTRWHRCYEDGVPEFHLFSTGCVDRLRPATTLLSHTEADGLAPGWQKDRTAQAWHRLVKTEFKPG